MSERPEPWENPNPARFHFEPMPAGDDWKVAEGRRCRWMKTGKSCGAPSLVALRRGLKQPTWWHYCADHTYGWWVENGEVWHWRLVLNEGPAA